MLSRQQAYSIIADCYERSGGHHGVFMRAVSIDPRLAGQPQAILETITEFARALDALFREKQCNAPTLVPLDDLLEGCSEETLRSIPSAWPEGCYGTVGPVGVDGAAGLDTTSTNGEA